MSRVSEDWLRMISFKTSAKCWLKISDGIYPSDFDAAIEILQEIHKSLAG